MNNTLYAFPLTADNGYFLYYNKQYFTENDIILTLGAGTVTQIGPMLLDNNT